MITTLEALREGRWPRSRAYPLAGALLAAGAPCGFLVLRAVLDGSFPTPRWVLNELSGQPWTYGYLAVSTTIVFVILGRILGKKDDLLQATSTTDSLTGLANRRHFDARLREEIARSERHGSPLSLLLVDVDGLKGINDKGGHEAGDVALSTVGTCLSQTCRRTDLAARIGGDEFAVLSPLTNAAEAYELANRIRAALSARRAGKELAPTVSIGVADLEDAASIHAADLYAAADAALYRAKSSGRDRAITAKIARNRLDEIVSAALKQRQE